MLIYSKPVEIRWSDLDPNFHLRHSVYYDWCAYVRVSYLAEHGITPVVMLQQHIGPVLFREECVFRREIAFGDKVEVRLFVVKARRDLSRWTMRHEVWKSGETLSAVVTVDGSWIDTVARKLAVPPVLFVEVFAALPKAEGFEWEEVPS